MQTVRLVIEGSFWDSQIYAGKLYLFSMDGSIRTVDWDRLIEGWPMEERLRLALTCAFQRSDYLYGDRWDLFFRDPEVVTLIRSKFKQLSEQVLTVDIKALEAATLSVQDNPLPFPHTDSTIYRQKLYVSDQIGVFSATCDAGRGRLKYPVSTRPRKLWDAEALSLAASYNALALAAGGEGLYQINLTATDVWSANERSGPHRLSAMDCNRCSWNFYSIFASSNIGHGYLVDFDRYEVEGFRGPEHRRKQRAVLDDEAIFGGDGYAWGRQEKLYQVRDSTIKIMRYAPWEGSEWDRLEPIGEAKIEHPEGDVIAGGVSLFGSVIEWDEGLLVIASTGDLLWVQGEPVNWRVFARSKHYENQLHVVYSDRLEIFSFNHDYFVDQNEKRFGLRFSSYRGGEAKRQR